MWRSASAGGDTKTRTSRRTLALPERCVEALNDQKQLLSDKGVPIEQIARLLGRTGGSTVTETVYRKQLRPVINDGAVVMNELFPPPREILR